MVILGDKPIDSLLLKECYMVTKLSNKNIKNYMLQDTQHNIHLKKFIAIKNQLKQPNEITHFH